MYREGGWRHLWEKDGKEAPDQDVMKLTLLALSSQEACG